MDAVRSVTYSIPVVFAKERARRGRAGNWYTPRTTQQGENVVASYTRKNVKETFTGPVQVTLVFTTKRKNFDLDNAIKGALDGIQKGKGFENDRQVRRIGAWMDEGESEETLVTISEMGEVA